MAKSKAVSPTLKLAITPEEWDKAVQASSGGCLITDAIKRQYPHLKRVETDMATVRFTDPERAERYTYLTPESAQALLLSYDQGWAHPGDYKVTIRRAVRIVPSVQFPSRAAKREQRLAELEAKEARGEDLTKGEKIALTKLRNSPTRPTATGPSEPVDGTDTIRGGRSPRRGPAHPNLLRGRNRVYGAKRAQPSEPFRQAVEQAVAEHLATL